MRSTLALYRDDGLLARSLGAMLRPLASTPQAVVISVGLLPMFVLIVLDGDGASHAAAGAALAWLVLVAGATSGRPPSDALRWATPPLLRMAEYAALLWIGSMAGESSQPAAFALIAALAFRHYDLVYRVRNAGSPPANWTGEVALGWDGRIVLGYILLVAGALPAGFYIAAGLLAIVFAAESIAGWRRYERAPRPVSYDDEEDEGA